MTLQTGSLAGFPLAVHNPLTVWEIPAVSLFLQGDAARQPHPLPDPPSCSWAGKTALSCRCFITTAICSKPVSSNFETLLHQHVWLLLVWGLTHKPPELNLSQANLSFVTSVNHRSTLTKASPFNFKQFLTASAEEGIWQQLLTSPEMPELWKSHSSMQNYLGFCPTHALLIVICFTFLSQYLPCHPICYNTDHHTMQFSKLLFTPASKTAAPHTVWGFFPFSTHSRYQAIIASWKKAFNSVLIKYNLWTFPCKRFEIHLCSKVDGFTL